jgi:hypothetical protein
MTTRLMVGLVFVAVVGAAAAGVPRPSRDPLLARAQTAVGVSSTPRLESISLEGRETRDGSSDDATVSFEYHRGGWFRRSIVGDTMGGRLRSVTEAVLTPTGQWSRAQSIDLAPPGGGQRVLRTDISDYGSDAAVARRNLLAERERLGLLLFVDVPAGAVVTHGAATGEVAAVSVDGAVQGMTLNVDAVSGRPRLLQYGDPAGSGGSPERRWSWEAGDFRKVGTLWLPHAITMTTQAGRKRLAVRTYRLGAVDPTTFVKPAS